MFTSTVKLFLFIVTDAYNHKVALQLQLYSLTSKKKQTNISLHDSAGPHWFGSFILFIGPVFRQDHLILRGTGVGGLAVYVESEYLFPIFCGRQYLF